MAARAKRERGVDWVIADRIHANWPGILPYRCEHSQRGYVTREAARKRRRRILRHYRTVSNCGPDLYTRRRVVGSLS